MALQRVGLSQLEIAAYQSLLSLGSRSASVFARESGVPRGNAYQVLLSLREKGFVQEIKKNNIKQFSPIPVAQVLEKLESLFREIAQARRALALSLAQPSDPVISMSSR